MESQQKDRTVVKPMSILIHCAMIIESDPDIASMLQDVLHEESVPTIVVQTMHDALQVTKGLQPLLFLINSHLSDGDGLSLYDQLLQRMDNRSIPAIILSTNINMHKQQLEERNVIGMDIPFEIDDLVQTIVSLLPPQLL